MDNYLKPSTKEGNLQLPRFPKHPQKKKGHRKCFSRQREAENTLEILAEKNPENYIVSLYFGNSDKAVPCGRIRRPNHQSMGETMFFQKKIRLSVFFQKRFFVQSQKILWQLHRHSGRKRSKTLWNPM